MRINVRTVTENTIMRISNNRPARNIKQRPTFFADHYVVLIVGVVGVSQRAVGQELELHELVPELALVPHTRSEDRDRL